METPNTFQGQLTEKIMAAITKKTGKLVPDQYNQLYSAVLDTLNEYHESKLRSVFGN